MIFGLCTSIIFFVLFARSVSLGVRNCFDKLDIKVSREFSFKVSLSLSHFRALLIFFLGSRPDKSTGKWKIYLYCVLIELRLLKLPAVETIIGTISTLSLSLPPDFRQ